MQLLSVEQAAYQLNIAIPTLRQWVSQRRIPFVKLQRRVLFDPSDLQKFINSQKVTSRQ